MKDITASEIMRRRGNWHRRELRSKRFDKYLKPLLDRCKRLLRQFNEEP